MRLRSLISPDILNELAHEARYVPAGDFVEVGVYQGGSALVLYGIAMQQGRQLWLFDTFTGIPYADPELGDRHKVGDFKDTNLDALRAAMPAAQFMVGLFPETLKPEPRAIALAHVDCDQYRSVRACIEELGPRMVPGGVIVFDDYNALPGAKRAVEEFYSGRVELSNKGKARVRF